MMLKNKKILITGIANKYSIALGIARAMKREGAEIAIAYQNERLLKIFLFFSIISSLFVDQRIDYI